MIKTPVQSQLVRKANKDTDLDVTSLISVNNKKVYTGVFTNHVWANPAKTIVKEITTTKRYYVKKPNGRIAKANLQEWEVIEYEARLKRKRNVLSF